MQQQQQQGGQADAHAAAWAQYYAQQAAAATTAPAVSQDAHAAAWAQYYAQQAAWQQHQQAALSGPHAEAWRQYYATAAGAAAAAGHAGGAGTQQQPVTAPAAQQPYGAQTAAIPGLGQQAPSGCGRPSGNPLHVGTATTVTSYHAVPPPGYTPSASAPATAPSGLPPPRPPPGPPPPQAAAHARPGIAAPYVVQGAAPTSAAQHYGGGASTYQAAAAPPPTYITHASAPAVMRPNAGGGASEQQSLRSGWPPQLRAWVERAFMSCGEDAALKAWIKAPMKQIIEDATASGELWTRNWDITPVPSRGGAQQQTTAGMVQRAVLPPQHGVPHASAFTAGGGASHSTGAWSQQQQQQQQQQYPAWMQQRSQQHIAGGAVPWQAGGQLHWQAPLPPPPTRRGRSRSSSRSSSYSRSRSRSRSDEGRGRRRKESKKKQGDGKQRSGKSSKLASQQMGMPPQIWNAADVRLLQHRDSRFGDGRAVGGTQIGDGQTGTQRRRAAVALQLSLAAEAGDGEGPDWDALTIKGTCTALEKSYFRLTSAPDPSTVRPASVLEAALERLRAGGADMKWFYLNDQCKALRQDLTVQRIRTSLTAAVYEFHARASLDAGDLAEYNQCATVLGSLYDEGVTSDSIPEFMGYRILYAAVAGRAHPGSGVASSAALAAALRAGVASEPPVVHARTVATALREGNNAAFFRLYRAASGHARALMDAAVEAVRFGGITALTRSCRPTVPVAALPVVLGIDIDLDGGDASDAALEVATKDWLVAHGAVLCGPDESPEVDCKQSAGALFVPVDENAVSHGDVDLDVTDFLKNF